jgi:hypothetical protein
MGGVETLMGGMDAQKGEADGHGCAKEEVLEDGMKALCLRRTSAFRAACGPKYEWMTCRTASICVLFCPNARSYDLSKKKHI